GRPAEGERRRRHAEGDARALARTRVVRKGGRGPAGPLPTPRCRSGVLDLGDPRPGPVLEPGVGEVVLDAMEAAFAHAAMIDTARGRRHGPFGSTWGP